MSLVKRLLEMINELLMPSFVRCPRCGKKVEVIPGKSREDLKCPQCRTRLGSAARKILAL